MNIDDVQYCKRNDTDVLLWNYNVLPLNLNMSFFNHEFYSVAQRVNLAWLQCIHNSVPPTFSPIKYSDLKTSCADLKLSHVHSFPLM